MAYARERSAFGGPIARFQGVQFPIADVAAKLDAARLLTLHAAALRDGGHPHAAAGAKAKLFASAVAVEAADVAVQTLGGYGYSADSRPSGTTATPRSPSSTRAPARSRRMVIARDLMGSDAR